VHRSTSNLRPMRLDEAKKKKERKKEIKKERNRTFVVNNDEYIMSASATQGGHKNIARIKHNNALQLSLERYAGDCSKTDELFAKLLHLDICYFYFRITVTVPDFLCQL